MKVSITLPSIYKDACKRAIDNINATATGDIEILVVSPFRAEGKNVVWIEETERRGCTFAHNMACEHATGDFIIASSDDVLYNNNWDAAALAIYAARKRDSQMLCLGINFGLIGTIFGIFYPNFPFMRLEDAKQIGYFDSRLKRGGTDCDLGLKVWEAHGRCEFTRDILLRFTKDDGRKGSEDCPQADLDYFLSKWAAKYGRGFDTSHMRSINVDFEPEKYPQFTDGFSVFLNSPDKVAEIEKVSPPHWVNTISGFKIFKFRERYYCVPLYRRVDFEKAIPSDIKSYLRYPKKLAIVDRPSLPRRIWNRLTTRRAAFDENEPLERNDG